jgi:hypothetical protein
MERRSCVRWKLKSQVGMLHYTSKVVRRGRTFFTRMLNLLQGSTRRVFRSDIRWWQSSLGNWKGVVMLENLTARAPVLKCIRHV